MKMYGSGWRAFVLIMMCYVSHAFCMANECEHISELRLAKHSELSLANHVLAVSIAPDSNSLALLRNHICDPMPSGECHEAAVYDIHTGEELGYRFFTKRHTSFTFLPYCGAAKSDCTISALQLLAHNSDGSQIAIGGYQDIEIYDDRLKQLLRCVHRCEGVTSLVWNNTMIAAGVIEKNYDPCKHNLYVTSTILHDSATNQSIKPFWRGLRHPIVALSDKGAQALFDQANKWSKEIFFEEGAKELDGESLGPLDTFAYIPSQEGEIEEAPHFVQARVVFGSGMKIHAYGHDYQLLAAFGGHAQEKYMCVPRISCSKNGKLLAYVEIEKSTQKGSIHVYELEKYTHIASFSADNITDGMIAPDGSYVVLVGEHGVQTHLILQQHDE